MKLVPLSVRTAKFGVTVLFLGAAVLYLVSTSAEPGGSVKAAGAALDPPTGVTASDNDYNDKIGLRWDTIWGATSYSILRNTTDNVGGASIVGSTAANYFFDTGPVAGQTYFYWVRAEDGPDQSAPSASDTGTRAIGETSPGPFNPLDPPPAPPGNPVTAAKAYLGKALFWDEQLSSTRTVACGTCHQPAAGGSDPRSLVGNALSLNPGPDAVFGNDDDVVGSAGVPVNYEDGTYGISATFGMNEQVTGRKAPSYLNAGYSSSGLFWDGRALDVFRDPLTNEIVLNMWGGLESQSAGPPLSAAEMAHDGRNWTQAALQIEQSKPLALAENIPAALETWIGGRMYPELFQEAFGTPDVTPARIALAIATHERTLFSDQTPLDRALANIEPLQPNEELGRQVFVVNQCNSCHGGGLLSDSNFHNIGVRPATEDGGRFNVTGLEEDRGRYKTPPLRNGELKTSFMHNGRFETLEEVVEFYERGGDFDAPNIDRGVIRPLNLTKEEKASLVAFLKRPMTDPRVENELPPFDRPTLYTEGSRVPVISGEGRTGTGGIVPLVTAIEPPIVGNPSFTVAVSDTIPDTQAVLVIDDADPSVGATIPASGAFTRTVVNIPAKGNPLVVASVSLQIPNDPALVGQTFHGRWYVNDPSAANGFSVSKLFSFTIFGEASVSVSDTDFDFDGDGATDVSVFRPNSQPTAQWWLLRSSDQGTRGLAFGTSTDVPVAADFTGDGK
ncbi:MAG TPA: cytochrome c peroxidase, partial [Aridibacter sp.]|nr:cytochrome c peroxidase [Aridibacter sp.]